MKKNFWIIPVLALLVVAGCSKQNIVPPTQPNIPSNPASTGAITTGILITGATIDTGVEDISNYAEELILNGFVPKEAYTASGHKYTLLLEKRLSGYIDRIFFPKGMWDTYLEGKKDLATGNHILFKGDLIGLRAIGKMSYYEVKNITELKKVGNSTKQDVINLVIRSNSCKKDTDCIAIYGKCPLPCNMAVNAKYSGIVEKTIDNFRNNQEMQCTYKCKELKGAFCNERGKCQSKQ